MPWGRCDDRFYRHAKVGLLPDESRKGAVALYWLAISWCNDHLTDGLVPAGTLRVLGADREEAEALVDVGLWDRDGGNYRVHDYLEFNKSKVQVEAERQQRSAAGAIGAANRWHPNGESHGESLGGSLGEMDGKPMPPSPVSRNPSPSFPRPWPAGSDRIEEAWGLIGRRRLPTEGQMGHIKRFLDAFEVTGDERGYELILRHPDDPIGALIAARRDALAERAENAARSEKAKPREPRVNDLTKQIAAHMRSLEATA